MDKFLSIDYDENNKYMIISFEEDWCRELQDGLDQIIKRENLPDDFKLIVLLEYQLCNGYTIVDPEEIGALTDSIILYDGYRYYWYPDYQIRSPFKELVEFGKVIFECGD
jgi:hypothetical protein